MSKQQAPALAPFAAVAAMLGLCCGLPLLASVGVLGAIAGIGFESWLVVALAAGLVAVGVLRWRRTAHTRPAPGADDSPSPLQKHTVLSPNHPDRKQEA
jgi:hypothetical protein